MFQLSPGHPPLSNQKVVETQALKFIRTQVRHIGTKIDIFVRRIGIGEVILSRREMVPVVKRGPHDKSTRGTNGMDGTLLRRHDSSRGCD